VELGGGELGARGLGLGGMKCAEGLPKREGVAVDHHSRHWLR
jgi:hypothetical protein